MGYIKADLAILVLHPDGRTVRETLTGAVSLDKIATRLGTSKPYVDVVEMADGGALYYGVQTGEINQQATKLLRTVKPNLPAVRGLALVTGW